MAKSKENKMKRTQEQDEDNHPVIEKGKKVEKLDVKIKSITENVEQKSSPIIGYFPSGNNPSMDSDVKLYKNVNSRNPKNPRMQLVVGSSDPKLNFVGTNYSGEATTPQLCNYALGVLDKETGVLKMVPIAANRIFRLAPKLGETEVKENEPEDEAKEETTKEDKLRTLTNKYTTKKNITRDKKRDTLRQTEDPENQEDFDQKLKEIKMSTKTVASVDDGSNVNSQNIPPYDLEATVPEMAYPLEKIIRSGEWEYLLDILELAEAGSEVNPDVYPSFVCNRIDKLRHYKDEERKKRMAGILSYITHLIKFKDRHSMDGVSSAKRHKFPSILSQKFSNMFGITNDRRMPDEKQKLLINYVLVLSLFADEFRSDPSDIAKDLRMNPITLRDFYGYLGCKLVRDNQVMLATLPVPLKFDTMKRKRRR